MEWISILRGENVIYAAYTLVGGSAFWVSRMLMQEQESRAAAENLGDARDRVSSNPLVRFTRPFFSQYFVPMVRGKPFWDKARLRYRRKLISGGAREELSPDEMIAFKLILILFFPIMGAALKALGFFDAAWYMIVGSSVLGWFYPDLWINSRIKDRQKQILRAMPFVVDLLALSTEAGLDFVGAIGKVVEKSKPSPLVDELSQVLKEIKVGSSRADALREMATRAGMTEMNSFVAILISADQMGAPIGRILRQQSEQIRIERTLRAEKAGAEASQKIMLPMIFLIVPAVFIVIMAPMILEWIYGSGGGIAP